MNRVDERRVELSFKKGELLCKQGMLSSHIIFIRQGFAKLFMEKDGEIGVLGIARPGTFVGAQSIYGEPVYSYSVEAITDTEVCLKDINLFRELILENPKFASSIIATLNADLIQSYKRVFSMQTKQVNSRLSELLIFLSNVLYQSNPFSLTISKREMATLISTSPETLSRLIADFKAQGIIRSSGQTIEILDVNELETLCKCDSLTVNRI